MISVRKLINSDKVLYWLVANHPDSPFLEYSGNGSQRYTIISAVCKVPEELVKPSKSWCEGKLSEGILLSPHGTVYSKERGAFVVLSDEFYSKRVTLDVTSALPDEFSCETCLFDVSVFTEKIFTEEEWKGLETLGAFTKPFQIHTMLLQ